MAHWRKHNMSKVSRKTKQKEQIRDVVLANDGFFSAEELYSNVKRKNKTIGIATVYRSLKDLDHKGEVHCYICGKRKLYTTENGNHCHFICHKCGRTEHFILKKVDFLRELKMGQACHFQVDIHGICRKCMEIDSNNQ
jgi:Fur family transcriptional regulator, ferric uptake regulator